METALLVFALLGWVFIATVLFLLFCIGAACIVIAILRLVLGPKWKDVIP